MIVITTPTGQIGNALVEELLARGESLRVIVRDASKLAADIVSRVEIVEGSHDDPEITMRAFEGADAVFYLVPPAPQAESVSGHYLAFAVATARAIVAHHIQHLVGVSTLGRGYAGNAGHLSVTLDAEPVLTATGVNYRSLAMPYFMDNLLNQVGALTEAGAFFMPNDADRELLVIATADVAQVAADLLSDRSWTGQEDRPVIGPDRLSPNQMAEVLAEVLGRPIAYHQVTPDAYKQTLREYGISEPWAQGLVDMAIAQNDGIYGEPGRQSSDATPTSLRSWAEQNLKPLVLG